MSGIRMSKAERADANAWLRSWDTGISSETIWSVMTGSPIKRDGWPWDPADFGRCYRLLSRFPRWRKHLHRVAEAFPKTPWVEMVKRWDELEALFVEESPSGKAPKLWAEMQKITG